MSIFTIQSPDGRKIRIEAADQATAIRGAQEWVKAHPAQIGGIGGPMRAAMSAAGPADRFDPRREGLAANIAAAPNDAIATMLGAPVDAMRTLINAATQPNPMVRNLPVVGPIFSATQDLSQQAGVPAIPEDSFGGRRSIIKGMEQFGITDPDTVEAKTLVEKIMRASAEGVTYAIAPEAMLALLGKAGVVGGRANEIMQQLFGRAASVRESAGNAVAGGMGGAGAELGHELAPEPLKPLATLVGGVGGTVAGVGLTALPKLPMAAADLTREFVAPMSQAGRERAVGRQLREGATNPAQTVGAIDAAPADLVPGAKPTTGQVTGDMGLLAMEREAATKAPVPFQQRRADQNAARVSTFENMQDGGAPEAVSIALRQRLGDIDKETAAALEGRRSTARVSDLAMGASMRPDDAGDVLRDGLEVKRKAAVEKERALWDAIDPDRSLVLAPMSTRSMIAGLKRDHPAMARPFGSEEASIYAALDGFGGAVPFQEFSGLRSRVAQALAEERAAHGKSPAWARLVQLRGAIEDDLEHAVERIVAQQADAVARGEMAPQETLWARVVTGWQDEWRARQGAAGANYATATGGNAGGRSTAVSGSRGTAGKGRGPTGYPPRDQGLPEDAGGAGAQGLTLADIRSKQLGERLAVREHTPNAPGRSQGTLTPAPPKPISEAGYAERAASTQEYTPRPLPVQPRPFDAAAMARLKTSTDATKARANTFDNRTLAPILARPSEDAPYNMAESARVASRVFMQGPSGYQRLQTYFHANNTARARKAIEGYALDRLRAEATNADGLLDPAKVAKWRRSYADALRAFPQLDTRISNASKAAEALEEVAVARKAALDDAQRDILGKVIGVSDPQDVTRVVASIFGRADSVRQMQQLRYAIGDNPEAMQGLRKAVVDHMLRRFVSNTEAATSGIGVLKSDQLQTFIGQNRGALKLAGFTDDELQTMANVAESLRQSNRSLTAVKIPGQSNTAQDILATRANETTSMSLLKALALAASSGGGFLVSGGVGAVAAPLLTATVAILRQRGLTRMDDLLREALLDPQLARDLMVKATPRNIQRSAMRIGRRFRRGVAAGVLAANDDGSESGPVEITIRGGAR